MYQQSRKSREKGAAAVEFALVLPLFLLLIFGIMESGWFFAQQVEIRHGAREGARLAAVSEPYEDYADIIRVTCERMVLSSGTATVTLSSDGEDVGATATIIVASDYTSLTGFLPFTGLIQTDVDFRLEQPRLWDQLGGMACP